MVVLFLSFSAYIYIDRHCHLYPLLLLPPTQSIHPPTHPPTHSIQAS